MKIEVGENNNIILKEVYNSVILETSDGEKLAVCMRDSGFEIDYFTKKISMAFEAKNGKVSSFKTSEEVKDSTISSIFKAAKEKGLKDVSVRIDSDLEWELYVNGLSRMETDEGTLEQLLSMILEEEDLSWMNK